MRILCLACVLVLLASLTTFGQECPADKAAQAGVSAMEAFHKFMSPAWHQAYPARDFNALIKAAPELEKAFVPIANMEARMKNPARKAAFLLNREDFAKYLKEYVVAAKAGNNDHVYELLPKLHEAFEKTAAACLTISYPEIEGVAVTTKLIIEKHLPTNNAEGVAGSTVTLVTKLAALDEKSIPESLKDRKTELLKEFAVWNKLAGRMKESFDKNDMQTYKKLASELNVRISDFTAAYL
jgi:hypothetical protein